MIAVDTNILVRYAIKDDRNQTETATRFLRHNQCLLLPTVALETVWVLSSKKAYALQLGLAERLVLLPIAENNV
jgi:predicted nucleic-acid-binding protein